MKPLTRALDKVTKPTFAKRGFASIRIITDWEKIVGHDVASCSTPRNLLFPKDKNSGGTLHIEVAHSALATEIVYMEPFILEKISCYFGYKAVSKLKVIQNIKANWQNTEEQQPDKKISLENSRVLDKAVAGIEDPDLRQSLLSLGQGILAE